MVFTSRLWQNSLRALDKTRRLGFGQLRAWFEAKDHFHFIPEVLVIAVIQRNKDYYLSRMTFLSFRGLEEKPINFLLSGQVCASTFLFVYSLQQIFNDKHKTARTTFYLGTNWSLKLKVGLLVLVALQSLSLKILTLEKPRVSLDPSGRSLSKASSLRTS